MSSSASSYGLRYADRSIIRLHFLGRIRTMLRVNAITDTPCQHVTPHRSHTDAIWSSKQIDVLFAFNAKELYSHSRCSRVCGNALILRAEIGCEVALLASNWRHRMRDAGKGFFQKIERRIYTTTETSSASHAARRNEGERQFSNFRANLILWNQPTESISDF